ncbi:helix-turn-helix DNA binding domain protein [Gordonia phage Nadmeg]|nr:helix-turn-helix DNA binding domain protein [Gordonia phage Nadmeg]
MIIEEDDYLAHYGILRRSGRYPWGSGGDANQNHRSFLDMVSAMRAEGLSDTDIAKGFDISSKDFRALQSIASNELRASNIAMAERLKDKGMSNGAIAERMGLPGESSVRSLLAPGAADRANQLQATKEMLKEQLENGGYLDVGAGVEQYAGMSRTQFDTALTALRNEGYDIINVQVDQVGGTGKTLNKVLVPEGTTYKDVVTNKDDIKSIAVKLTDDGPEHVRPPEMLELDRLKINYAEDGGTASDGMMSIRPGVADLDMGGSHYAQVRIAVDGTHYLKGMAVLDANLPPGVDVVFNTNKSNTGNPKDALKPLKKLPLLDADGKPVLDSKGKPMESDEVDASNPFGATIKPGGQRGKLNIVNEAGDWTEWSNSTASQMLSKQDRTLVREQLDKVSKSKQQELDEIMSLTNPAVRVKLLQSYADDVDAAAVHLKGAAMPRQATKVILPVNSMKDTEIYAPTFKNGERVALVRYPHGGTFEIPELTVNNRQKDAKRLLGNAVDAVGINSKVAERLSGADFDGDSVVVIPNNSGKIKSTPALEGLKNFDPKARYPAYEGMKPMTSRQTQLEMGNVSNLITDMTIKGANTSEIARAVRHSMVVIDAEKHKLNYKQSAIDNGIPQLKAKYQGSPTSGASTLVSRSTSELKVPKRQMGYRIDPSTGEKIYKETGEGYTKRTTNKKTGEVKETWVPALSSTTKGAEAKDAHTLSSGTAVEKIYADHSNRLKAMGNQARKELVSTKPTPYSPSAKKVYSREVESLNAKLNVALKNAPRERQAQVLANAVVRQKREANPDMQSDELRKVSAKALATARARTGANKDQVVITPREWEAIQSGAVSNHKLTQILNNADIQEVKKLATPRENKVMTSAKQQRARNLLASGRTPSEVAQILGVPVSTLTSSMK